jgi:hypothetical protein
MQQHSKHLKRWTIPRPSVSILVGAAALLAMLVMASWGTARAAPLAGGPTLTIVSISGNTLTLEFDNWATNQPLTLSYSQSRTCSPNTSLPPPSFQVTSSLFQTTYTLPNSIAPGNYFLCANDSVDGTNASANTFIITNTGTVQPTPGTPGPSPTSTRGPGAGSPGATSAPGNQGASSSPPNNNSIGNTLVAIILLCLLVMALLAYLIRLWLQGRQSGGQPPTSP